MNDPIMTDMRSEYSKSLIQVGHENSNVVVLGADTTDSLKTSGFGKQFPDRFFNVGIAEANLVTMSAGLAVSGKVSFASTYAIFLPGRAVDQIRNNIAYGLLEDKSEKQIINASKTAHAYDFIMSFERGFDTLVGDNGVLLSGGQRQRIAIARAILKDSPILLLDEATSSLDSESEKLIQKALEDLRKNRTTIVIAHRLSTIEKADNIIVLDEGKIVEQGNHKTLIENNGLYSNLHKIQFPVDR